MNPRRLFLPVVLGLLAAAGLAYLVAQRTWGTAQADGTEVSVSGLDAVPVTGACALVLGAAALALLVTGPVARRIVGVIAILAAIGGAIASVTSGRALETSLESALEASPTFTGADVLAYSYTPWIWVCAVVFVLAAGISALTVWAAGAWPTMSSRYDAPAARQDDGDPWKALDEGRDPTE